MPSLLPSLLTLLLSLLPFLPPPLLSNAQPLCWGFPKVPEERGAGNSLLSPPSPHLPSSPSLPLPPLASPPAPSRGVSQVQRLELPGRLLHGGHITHPHQR